MSQTDSRENNVLEADEVQDDEIIGVAFRRSVFVVLGLAFAAAIAWWSTRDRETPTTVDEVTLDSPAVLPADSAPILPVLPFADVTASAGIKFEHHNGATGERLLPETMGGGVAFTDLDGDGDADLLFVNSRDWPWSGNVSGSSVSRLYLNDGTGVFTDATARSGLDEPIYGMGVAVGDADGDGVQDIFLTAVGHNRLLRGLGAGRFEDITVAAGVAGGEGSWSTAAAFLDFDRDGDLDLYVANYVEWNRELDFEVDYRLAGIGRAYGPPGNFPGTQPYLYRNDGQGRFEEVAEAAGLFVSQPGTGAAVGKGLAAVVEDVNGDSWPDLVVANDTVRNFLFINDGGRFREEGVGRGLAYDNSGHATGAMGIDIVRHGDSGGFAVAMGNFANEMTSYYVSTNGGGLFSDEAIIAGMGPVSRSVLSFGLFFFDADLDGRLDLLQANGHVENDINLVQASQAHAQPAQFFWNCGESCPRRFVPLPEARLGDLPAPMVGRGAAFADMDADGDLDVVLTAVGGPARLLRNDQSVGHRWLRVRLEGDHPNPFAVGALVRIRGAATDQQRRVDSTRSYLSQTELTLTFGLGSSQTVERLEVTWPDGTVQVLENIQADQEILIRRGGPSGRPAA
jgi:hypothetical protein